MIDWTDETQIKRLEKGLKSNVEVAREIERRKGTAKDDGSEESRIEHNALDRLLVWMIR